MPSVTPAFCVAASIRSIRLSDISSGFSQITGTRRLTAAITASRWLPEGVATVTKSGFSRRSIRALSSYHVQPNSAAKALPFSSVRHDAATRFTPSISARARACSLAIAPIPIIAARMQTHSSLLARDPYSGRGGLREPDGISPADCARCKPLSKGDPVFQGSPAGPPSGGPERARRCRAIGHEGTSWDLVPYFQR